VPADTPTPYRVLLVDEHAAVQRGVAAMLAPDDRLELVGHASSGDEAVELAALHSADVVLLDHDLAGASGLAACLKLKTTLPSTAVLVYFDSVDDDLVTTALVAGADGVLGTEAGADELCETLCATARGERHLPSVSPQALTAAGSRLDPSDLPIFAMLRHRTPPAEIARTLGTNIRRVSERRWAMLERMSARPPRPPAAAAL